MEPFRVQAEFIVVTPQRVIHRGQIVVAQGRIVEVCESTEHPADLDLGATVLLPGLVNCHTHLEFSDLQQPIEAGRTFPDWIGSVVRHRRQQMENVNEPQLLRDRRLAILAGARECFAAGTAVIADIVTQPWRTDFLPTPTQFVEQVDAPNASRECTELLAHGAFPRFVLLPEVIGLDNRRFESSLAAAQAIREQRTELAANPTFLDCGLSPHAPYSLLHPQALEQMKWCVSGDRCVAMHVAESPAEIEWAETGLGPFERAFRDLGLSTTAERMQIADAIEMLGQSKRALLIHGNYLTDRWLDRIASTGIHVVYCPRTHQHFRHSEYPLQGMRDRGIRVVLGTDSRASSPDLNLWEEVRVARSRHADWPPDQALASVTTEAAKALGCHADWGSLEIGKVAWFNALPAANDMREENLVDQLTGSASLNPLPLPLYLMHTPPN